MDLDKPLKSFIEIRGNKLLLEYEGLHLICFKCGKYGHKANQCGIHLDNAIASSQVQKKSPLVGSSSYKPVVTVQESNQIKESNANYGSWMVATSRKPRKQQKPQTAPVNELKNKEPKNPNYVISQKKGLCGSRFNVLTSDQNISEGEDKEKSDKSDKTEMEVEKKVEKRMIPKAGSVQFLPKLNETPAPPALKGKDGMLANQKGKNVVVVSSKENSDAHHKSSSKGMNARGQEIKRQK